MMMGWPDEEPAASVPGGVTLRREGEDAGNSNHRRRFAQE